MDTDVRHALVELLRKLSALADAALDAIKEEKARKGSLDRKSGSK